MGVRYLILGFALAFGGSLLGQGIKWYTWDEAMIKAAEAPEKKIIIDMYTNWCGWCKKMDQATFGDPIISQYINENYIPIKFNAERKGDIEFKGKVFKFKKNKSRGYHELAAALMQGNMKYPTVVFLDENQNMIQPISGFMDVQTFDPVMRYISEDLYKRMPWANYIATYKSERENDPNTRLVKGND